MAPANKKRKTENSTVVNSTDKETTEKKCKLIEIINYLC